MVAQNNEAYSGGGGGKLLASTSTVKKLGFIPIKVMNVARKRDSKTCMLNLNIEPLQKDLCEDLLDQARKKCCVK